MRHLKCSEKGYIPLTKDEYKKNFLSDKKIMREAYNRAWQTRNFEIDKFWLRTAFFWGFIALIFGGYITVMTSDNNKELISMNFDIYLILLGIIFSFAWFLVILGSKSWVENWEAHIDMLEKKITGPLYKTISLHHNHFYSPSRINIGLSLVIILVWIVIFLMDVIYIKKCEDINLFFIIAVIITLIAIVSLFVFCRTQGGEWKIKKHKDNSHTEFINRWD
jgi:hypothetical protein